MAAGVEEGFQFLQHAVGSLLSDYGWYILFSLIAIYLLVQKLPKSFRGPRRSHLDAAAVEPDAVVRRQEALLAARLKMQEELNTQAEKFKEKQRKVEEEKRKQKIAMWESMQEGKSYKETLKQNQEPEPGASTSAAVPKPRSKGKPLRNAGYNPLSGEGGGLARGDQDAEALQQVDEANSAGVFLLTLAGINLTSHLWLSMVCLTQGFEAGEGLE
ncbi:LOW QUALITY PROTEIN: selenoprotein S [Elgaria multicarinata webbii]|uniref:LOW QUALITY PROTEIN: selenoprotein S n=1 Tax=Elgaria multicarinata webbii TaxID=159646 RepID=UPI002FCD4985